MYFACSEIQNIFIGSAYRVTDKLMLTYLSNYFSGIPNCFSNRGYQQAKELMNTQLKQLMLHRKDRRKVLLPI